MAGPCFRGLSLRPARVSVSSGARALICSCQERRSHFATTVTSEPVPEAQNEKKKNGRWFTLPQFTSTVDAAALGKVLSGRRPILKDQSDSCGAESTTTALKWVLRCCPHLPSSLVQKLFRLRQVRRESSSVNGFGECDHAQEHRLKRVSAKDRMKVGDQIYLPVTVCELPSEKTQFFCNEEEMNFLHSLELYKDPAIIVVNKPPGMPVQGGIGIRKSLDVLAATHMRYDYDEPPRLVHRLDKDSSGILVMGRTQLSATILHSIFREKTFGAVNYDLDKRGKFLQRKYWALVIGTPRSAAGLISVSLGKVIVDNGKSERITVVDNVQEISSQLSVTKYRVIGSSSHGYTWLELSPLTGRKHQLRVHCAEVLGAPIVGDYKYGWQAHRNWKPLPHAAVERALNEKLPNETVLPFGLNSADGSVSGRQPHLHLHCKEMVLPNVSLALEHPQLSSDCDLAEVGTLRLDAPLPSHMQRSWDILN